MKKVSYYHLCADGAAAKCFLIGKEDAYAAFNLVGVCAFHCKVKVVAFSIEDSHPHFLLYGTESACLEFMRMYNSAYKKHIVATRGSLDGIQLDWTLYEITDESYLMNVGTYVINQATKDGKKVMPYDYLLGTGSMYFRPENHIPIWCIDENGQQVRASPLSCLNRKEQKAFLHSRMSVPESWTVCNGYLLPENYVATDMFESIYRTYNCYRTFLSSGKNRDDSIVTRLAEERGISMEDSEIRKPCGDLAKEMFGFRDIRKLTAQQRLALGLEIRKRFHLSRRQIALVIRLPLKEIERYIR